MNNFKLEKRRWTPESDSFLSKFYRAEGGPYCAHHLHRTPEAVKCRARELGLTRTKKKAQEDRFMRERVLGKFAAPERMGSATSTIRQSDFIAPISKNRLMGGR
jgi:hypothetical protein